MKVCIMYVPKKQMRPALASANMSEYKEVKPGILGAFSAYRARVRARRPRQIMKSRAARRIMSMCYVAILIGCGIGAITPSMLGVIFEEAIPVVADINGAFQVLRQIGAMIVKGFQMLGSVVCLIGFFRELTQGLLQGDGKDIGGSAWHYGIGFAMFFIMPLIFETIRNLFGG